MTAISPNGEKTPREGRFLLALVFSVLGTLALAGAWLAPNHYPPWVSFHGEAAAFAALAAFAAARLAWPQATVRTGAPWLVGAVLLLIAGQWWSGQIAYRGDAFVSGLYVAGWGLAWWLGTNSAGLKLRTHPAVWFAWIVVFAAMLSVAIALLQWLRMETTLGIFAIDRAYDVRAYGNLGQPNHLASLLMIASALALMLYTCGRIGGFTCVMLIAWFSLGLTLSESRSGLLSAFCLGTLLWLKRRLAPQLPAPRWIALWWALLVTAALAWPAINAAMHLDAPRGALAGRDSARQVIWKQCITGIEASPWVGYGWRQSIVGQKVGAASIAGWQMSDYAHNIVLDLMLWVGVPLAILFTAVGCWWLIRMFLRLRGSVEVLLFGAILPLLVHSMFEFPFAYSYFLFPAAWLLAMLARMQRERPVVAAQPSARGGSRLAAGVALALFAGTLVATGLEYLQAEEDYRVMRFELRRVGRTPEGYAAPDLMLLTQLDEMLKAGRIVPRPHMPPAEMDRLREAASRFGWATLQLSYAIALALNGDAQRAAGELRLLHASYGDESYAQARFIWRNMQAQYPDLAAVHLP